MKKILLNTANVLIFIAIMIFPLKSMAVKSRDTAAKNPVKEKLHNGEAVYGAFVTIPSPKVIEMTNTPGLEFIWLEAEHTEWSANEVLSMVIACENEG